MAQDPRRRPPARRNGPSNEPIRLETGDFESIGQDFDGEDDAPVLPPTKVLPNDPQRAVPTGVFEDQRFGNNPESFNPPLPSDSFNPPIPSDTHPIPEIDPRNFPPDRTRPGPSVRGHTLEPAFLYVDRGPGEGRNVPIPAGEMVIGRSSASGLKLSHPSVSREHAILERQSGRFYIHDAGSHNGTFVNGRQISGRIELYGGDEIAMGKAVLILRHGDMATGTGTGTRAGTSTHNAPLTDRKAFKITVFGSAVALGILSVLILAKLKPNQVDESRVAAAAPARPAPLAPTPIKPEPKPLALAPRPEPRPEPPPEPEPEVEAPPSRPVKTKGDLNLDQPTEVSAAKVFAETKKNTATPPPPRYDALDNNKPLKAQPKKAQPTKVAYTPKAPMSSVDTSDAAEAMALYEAGDLDGAIASARSAGNAGLANKIANFKKEIGAAKGCLSGKDGVGAIKHYTTALAVDDELSKGWGKLGGQIRGELAKLYEKAAAQALSQGDGPKATQLFQKALKYDPENIKAQEGLAAAKKLGSAPAPKSDDARSAADQAFDQ
ncbi:MAG: FHA domain-containing protein [Myxococcales bacterium]